MLFIYDITWIFELSGIAVSLHLGILATALAYYLFVKGLVRVTASTAVTLSLAEPLTAAMLGVFLIREALTVTEWIGVGFLLLGIAVLSINPKRKKL